MQNQVHCHILWFFLSFIVFSHTPSFFGKSIPAFRFDGMYYYIPFKKKYTKTISYCLFSCVIKECSLFLLFYIRVVTLIMFYSTFSEGYKYSERAFNVDYKAYLLCYSFNFSTLSVRFFLYFGQNKA